MNSHSAAMHRHIHRAAEGLLRNRAGEWADYPRGVTPRDTVWRAGNISLLRFHGSYEGNDETPLLIVPSLINRWYILDLTPDTSFITPLSGDRPVFLIDWGYPGAESAHLPLSHFYHRTIKRVLRQIRRLTGHARVDMLGYCIGGTMVYAYSCLEPLSLRRMALLTAPVDFSEAGILGRYAAHFPAAEIARAMHTMPGDALAASFNMMQPMGSYQKWKMFFKKCEDPRFVELFTAMERWIADPVDFPVQAYRELIEELYRDNRLYKGLLHTAEGHRVNPEMRCAEALLLNAGKDHIAPAASTRLPAADRGPIQKITIPSGHIGITTGRASRNTCAALRDFLGTSESA